MWSEKAKGSGSWRTDGARLGTCAREVRDPGPSAAVSTHDGEVGSAGAGWLLVRGEARQSESGR